MKGSGCHNCPVRRCTAAYRGSRCAHLRESAGVDFDPMTQGDRIRSMSDRDLALYMAGKIASVQIKLIEDQGYEVTGAAKKQFVEALFSHWYRWIREPVKESSNENSNLKRDQCP